MVLTLLLACGPSKNDSVDIVDTAASDELGGTVLLQSSFQGSDPLDMLNQTGEPVLQSAPLLSFSVECTNSAGDTYQIQHGYSDENGDFHDYLHDGDDDAESLYDEDPQEGAVFSDLYGDGFIGLPTDDLFNCWLAGTNIGTDWEDGFAFPPILFSLETGDGGSTQIVTIDPIMAVDLSDVDLKGGAVSLEDIDVTDLSEGKQEAISDYLALYDYDLEDSLVTLVPLTSSYRYLDLPDDPKPLLEKRRGYDAGYTLSYLNHEMSEDPRDDWYTYGGWSLVMGLTISEAFPSYETVTDYDESADEDTHAVEMSEYLFEQKAIAYWMEQAGCTTGSDCNYAEPRVMLVKANDLEDMFGVDGVCYSIDPEEDQSPLIDKFGEVEDMYGGVGLINEEGRIEGAHLYGPYTYFDSEGGEHSGLINLGYDSEKAGVWELFQGSGHQNLPVWDRQHGAFSFLFYLKTAKGDVVVDCQDRVSLSWEKYTGFAHLATVIESNDWLEYLGAPSSVGPSLVVMGIKTELEEPLWMEE